MRPIIFSLFLWSISIVLSLQAAPDLIYLNIATQAANWILSREVDEKPKAGYWTSRADFPIEEKRDLYNGNAGTLVFLHELNRPLGGKSMRKLSGSAGIGLTLLSFGQELRRPELINLAIQAGTDLLATANRFPDSPW